MVCDVLVAVVVVVVVSTRFAALLLVAVASVAAVSKTGSLVAWLLFSMCLFKNKISTWKLIFG